MIRLVIEKMSKGGFVVYQGDGLGQGGLVAAIFAPGCRGRRRLI